MDLACQTVAFLDGCEPCCGTCVLGGKLGTLDGQSNLVADNMQQLELVWPKFAPILACDVHHSQYCIACMYWHTSMKTQAQCAWIAVALSVLQPTAAQHIHV